MNSNIFQLFVSRGINLENVIHHENDDISKLLSDNYWIFILKWLYNFQDSSNDDLEELLGLIKIIEANFHRLKKTAKLLIALDRRKDFDLNDDFYPLVLHTPGQIFSTLAEEELFISPIIISLANQDVQLLGPLTLHPSYKTKPLFFDIGDKVFEWKNRLITLFLDMLRKDQSFFQRKDVLNFLESHVTQSLDKFYDYFIAAKIFVYCEENEFDKGKELL